MNPEEKELLQKTYDLSKENNRILHGLRRSNRYSTILSVFYWIIIIGVSVGAFVYLQPYIDTLTKTYGSLQTDFNNIKSVTGKISNFNTSTTTK